MNIKHIIAVSSGKGGVGKSTVSVNLSISLSKKKYKVGLLDADIYGPSIHKMMGEDSKPNVSEEKKILPFEKFGIKFMSIGNIIPDSKPVIWRGTMVVNALRQLLKDISWGNLDFLIIDLPPGTGDVQLSLSQNLNFSGAVVVSTPQEVSLIDVRRSIGMFKRVNVYILGLIQNMSFYENKKENTKDYVFGKDGVRKEALKENINFLGEIPILSSISKGSDDGKPESFNDKSVESKIFDLITDNLLKSIKNIKSTEIEIEN
tara:strand:+ start:517 stop:1299 length:783 start_codon:yes stop_codon:yes gene_type:complete